MSEQKPPRKKPGPAPRYAPGKRPTLTFRVQEPLHERLKAMATASGRSLSEEIERRVERAFEWDDAHGEVRNWVSEQKVQFHEMTDAQLEAEMRQRGWKPIGGTTRWERPGVVPKSGFIDPAEAVVEAKPKTLDPDVVEAIRAVIREELDARDPKPAKRRA